MLWGKLIDHDRCIGCHACSVACKSENQVPLGSFRTWVKQVEKGSGPSAKRHFGVLRCNQCQNPPCVAICPTAAMFQRGDGIVDFDKELCVGCKGCIQACPYDAIYIDPNTNTAAKCNFCAHRLEAGLEPACVAACPTIALLVSDLHDPTSAVAHAVSRLKVQVRKPELGTRPKVYYKGADACVLDPHAATPLAQGYWGQSRAVPVDIAPTPLPLADRSGPLSPGAPAAARVAYDVPRDGAPWGEKITAYLFVKAIAAGALMIGGLALLLRPPEVVGLHPPTIALLGILATFAFLLSDLKRPDRFMLLLFKPQTRSWLVKGAWVLMAGSAVACLWGLAFLVEDPDPWLWQGLGVCGIVSGVAVAGYTALLFGQAKGRRFWQSPLLFPHLVIQAGLAGSCVLAIAPGLTEPGVDRALRDGRLLSLSILIGVFLALNLLMILGELWSHPSEDARRAVRWMQSGEQGTTLYLGVLALGHVFPAAIIMILFIVGNPELIGLAAVAALVGVLLWDHLYVGAGQAPPLS